MPPKGTGEHPHQPGAIANPPLAIAPPGGRCNKQLPLSTPSPLPSGRSTGFFRPRLREELLEEVPTDTPTQRSKDGQKEPAAQVAALTGAKGAPQHVISRRGQRPSWSGTGPAHNGAGQLHNPSTGGQHSLTTPTNRPPPAQFTFANRSGTFSGLASRSVDAFGEWVASAGLVGTSVASSRSGQLLASTDGQGHRLLLSGQQQQRLSAGMAPLPPEEAFFSSWDEPDSMAGAGCISPPIPTAGPAASAVGSATAPVMPHLGFRGGVFVDDGRQQWVPGQQPATADVDAAGMTIIPQISLLPSFSAQLGPAQQAYLEQQLLQQQAVIADASTAARDALLQLYARLAAAERRGPATGELCSLPQSGISSSGLCTLGPAQTALHGSTSAACPHTLQQHTVFGANSVPLPAPGPGTASPGGLFAQLSDPVAVVTDGLVLSTSSLLLPEPPRMCSSSLCLYPGPNPGLGRSSIGPCVLGNDVASVAAAMAQEKLAQMQELEALQQQLRRDVVSLLPLV